MKSVKGRMIICWLLALLLAFGGSLAVTALYAFCGDDALLTSYLFNALLQVISFAAPALLVLYARDTRWQRFINALRPIGIDVVGPVSLGAVSATVAVSLAAGIWSVWLESATGMPAPVNPVLYPQGVLEWALALLSIAVVPALAEELLFRALLQGVLYAKLKKWGVWIAAFVFAAVHFEWYALPGLLIMGLTLGFVYEKRGLWASALFHALYNAAVTVLSARSVQITPLLALICVIAFIYALKRLMREEISHETNGTGL